MATVLAKMSSLAKVLTTVVVVALLVAAFLVFKPQQARKYITAQFPRTVSLYEGSDVRILGVPVGKVETVTPHGTEVTVRMWYDAQYKVPANAKAIIISPAIVGDRFIQLTPVYRKGPVMASDVTLNQSETATPLELDQIYRSIDDLMVALGPKGANRDGALKQLMRSTARNFNGQGAQFHQTIMNFSKLTATLDHNKKGLFGTARQLERFTSALANNDHTVRRFNDSLVAAAGLLKDERGNLAASLHNLGIAMREVSSFVRQNKGALGRNIHGLNQVSKVLVKQRAALDETLTDAPLALTNLFHTYNPKSGTLDTRTNLGENINALTADPAAVLCAIVHQGDPSGQACDAIKNALGGGGGLPLSGINRSAPFGSHAHTPVVNVEHIDRSLGGIVAVK